MRRKITRVEGVLLRNRVSSSAMRGIVDNGKKRGELFGQTTFYPGMSDEEVVQDESKWNTAAAVSYETSPPERPTFGQSIKNLSRRTSRVVNAMPGLLLDDRLPNGQSGKEEQD